MAPTNDGETAGLPAGDRGQKAPPSKAPTPERREPPRRSKIFLVHRATPLRRWILIVLAPVALIVLGAVGYPVIEPAYSLFDGLYMTVITLSTLGYGEVHPLGTAGRVFTMVLILGGVFTLFYAMSEIVRAIITGEIESFMGRRRMQKSLENLQGHLIVCGFGRMGRLVCEEFSKQQEPFVVVDADSELLQTFRLPFGIPLHGDATSDDVLRLAGIDRARGLVTVMASDADNLYTTMSARLLNKDLFIVARMEDPHSEEKLRRAGANRVVSPYQIGGNRLAHAVLRPTVVDFIEELASGTHHVALQIEETRIQPASALVGQTLQASRIRSELKVMIVAVKKEAGNMIFSPASDTKLEAGDVLVAIGPRDQLDRLDEVAKG